MDIRPLRGSPSEQLSVFPGYLQDPWPQGLTLPVRGSVGDLGAQKPSRVPSARTSALPPYLTAALDTPIPAASWHPDEGGEVMGSQASVSAQSQAG